jgi:hypothetical protein
MRREAQLELWLGRKVFDCAGAKAGRIEEFEAEGDRITHVLTGEQAVVERLWGLHRVSRRRRGYRIRWDQLRWPASGDMRTKVALAELERI